MACFLKVFRLIPCFSKNEIFQSETDLVFHAKYVNAQEFVFVKNPPILHPYFIFAEVHFTDKCFSMQKYDDYPPKIHYPHKKPVN